MITKMITKRTTICSTKYFKTSYEIAKVFFYFKCKTIVYFYFSMDEDVDYVSLKDSLDEVGCPYITALDSDSLRDLLFRPGETRLRFFTWLISQISDGVDNELNSPVINAQVKESKLQQLLRLVNGLGLCKRHDIELIQGSCSIKKQLRFYQRVIGMLKVKLASPHDSSASAEVNAIRSCNSSSRNTYTLVSDLTTSLSYSKLFQTKLNLFPPSLLCMNNTSSNKSTLSSKKSMPSNVKLKERAERFSAELATLQDNLASISEQDYQVTCYSKARTNQIW